MFTRRTMMLATGAFALAPRVSRAASRDAFVVVDGTEFRVVGRRYPFVVANCRWDALSETGLSLRLDALKARGVTTLRLIEPSTAETMGSLRRLDLLLAELARRDMKAIMPLANFWDRSGGMATYLRWTGGGRQRNAGPTTIPYHDHVRALVERTNAVTGVAYARDPTIMAWRLADQPLPNANGSIAPADLTAYYGWIRDASALVRRLAPHHLISTGGEGLKTCMAQATCGVGATVPDIDYVTTRGWPQSWSDLDAADLAAAGPEAERLAGSYIACHRAIARRLNKPLVIEDDGRFPAGLDRLT